MENQAIQQLLDIEAIKQLKGLYCLCVATEDWTTFFTLFTADLEFVTPTEGVVYDSRDAFYAMHKKNLQDTKCWGVVRCYTPIITMTGADTASGIWAMEDVHIYPGEGSSVGHHGYGQYYENYVRTAEGWRFHRIQVKYNRLEPLAGGYGPAAK